MTQHKKPLSGKVCLVTGGARGIGLATAKRLKRNGARVAISDVDATLGNKIAKSEGFVFVRCDVRHAEDWKVAVEQVSKQLGPIDCLVNNAGIMPMKRFMDETDAMVQASVDINLMGVVHGVRAVLPEMEQKNAGHIVNVSSMCGAMALPGAAIYCASKFAVVGLTETLAHEYRHSNIGFSVVMPSKVNTELSAGTNKASKLVPSVEPEDVAKAVCKALETKKLHLSVPEMLFPLHHAFTLLPQFIQRKGRALVNDHVILNGLDQQAHASYEQRINQLSKSR